MFTLSAKTWLTTYFINFYFIWGVFLPFWGIWLTGQGVTTEQVGVLFSIGLVLRFVSSLTVLPRVSTGSGTLKVIRSLGFITLLSFASLFYLQGYVWLASLTLFINFVMGPMMPLGDIVGSRLVKQVSLDYGKVRLWGSASFIAGSTTIGWLIVDFGLQSILALIVATSVVMWGLSLAKLSPQLVDQNNVQSAPKQSLIKLLKKPEVLLFLLITGMIQGSHGAYYAFSAIYWDSLGIAGNIIAWLWVIAVLAEILILRFNVRLFSKWTIKQMLLLGLVGGILRWSVIAMTDNVYLLAVVQTLHGLTFAVTHLAAIRYISKQESSQLVAYQSLYSGVALGLLMALFTFISGMTYDALQGNLFLLSTLLLLPVFLLIKRWQVIG
ncbi:3-phenylpropionate MFS transporter [Psychromonas sp. psych-6C06]|uniref:3-phenylpropionate MFS transporter n=1 Tax=Psychromonas sp. psych-6C06 TaxID=2058089 RepID=UPI000C3319FD|nr:3-phenylpropionate MFS transporter [Psychromonas sp. psych-6C06]PKF62007.1 3-phenylpropionate MFS transporter [Psychromonas sp. psych-6C06]